jgi:hypothetical protein
VELFGILFGIPATLIASAIYTGIVLAIFAEWPVVKKPAVILSLAEVALLVVEIGFLISHGPRETYFHFHSLYSGIHLLNIFLAPPAVANLILASTSRWKRNGPRFFWERSVAGSCAVPCCSATS